MTTDNRELPINWPAQHHANNNIGVGILRKIGQVIVDNLDVDDVFPEHLMAQWIEKNVISNDGGYHEMLADYVALEIESAKPGDTLHSEMHAWAEANGYERRRVV